MKLFVIIARGSYALSVDVVRAATAFDALKLVHPQGSYIFTSFEVKEVAPSGKEPEVIIGANYIE